MGMSVIVEQAICEIKLLANNVPDGKHIVTGDIRKLSARLYRGIKDKTIDNVLSICDELLREHSWGLGVIAFDWAYRVKAQYMVNENFTEEQAQSYLKEMLPKLDYWKRYDELSDNGQFEEFKKQLINEINDLHIDGLPRVDKLNALVGKYVNLEYTLPNGQKAKFLDDQKTYLGNQLESEFGGDRCFGILAGIDFILVCTYEKDGENPELVIYKKR